MHKNGQKNVVKQVIKEYVRCNAQQWFYNQRAENIWSHIVKRITDPS